VCTGQRTRRYGGCSGRWRTRSLVTTSSNSITLTNVGDRRGLAQCRAGTLTERNGKSTVRRDGTRCG
jgi:hypothetical protein